MELGTTAVDPIDLDGVDAALDEENPHFPKPLWQPVPQCPSVFPQKPYVEQHSP